jgi:hypothetical protein
MEPLSMSRPPAEASSSATTAINSDVSDSDIVHLLWFLNKVLGIHDSIPYIWSTEPGIDDPVLKQCMKYPLPNTPKATDRLRILLDAICAVTVGGQKQVLAMTLACNGHETRLCLAQNSTQVPLSVSDFVSNLWTCLQELSRIQMVTTRRKGLASNQQDLNGDCPPAETQNQKLNHQLRRIRSMVYRHCYRQFHRRVTKREGQLQRFWIYFQRVRDRNDPIEDELFGVLYQAMEVQKFMIDHPEVPEDKQLNGLAVDVIVLNRRLTAFLGDDSEALTKDSVATLLRRSDSFERWLEEETIRTPHSRLAV